MNTTPTHKRMPFSLYAVIFLITAFTLTGCSKPIEKAIIGKWKEDPKGDFPDFDSDSGMLVEFFNDNTVLLYASEPRGTWAKIGDNRIKIDIKITKSTLLFDDIRISGNKMETTLNMSSPRGTLNRVLRATRVK